MGEIIWLLVAITALFLVLVVPVIGLVALIKPSWFSKIGENRKQISLKLFGAFLVGCILCAALPEHKSEVSTQQSSVQTENQNSAKEKPTAKEEVESAKVSANRNDPKMTLDEFNRIETGMTPEQVKEIVGGLGKVASESDMAGYKTVILQFDGKGSLGANANVTFQNGRVVMKAQAGLK